jgi:DNA repair exonuclease SbcCD nuclease subunit
VTVDERLELAGLDLEICGTPHAGYHDMSPLHLPGARTRARQIVMAHGHWATGPHDAHRSWLIFDEEIAATAADYVALGHWDLAQRVGDGSVPAYYSGSPLYSGSINIVRIADGAVDVRRQPLREGAPEQFPPT